MRPWYESGTFWTIAEPTIVSVLAIVITVWVTWRASNPRRRLLFSMPLYAPLLNAGRETRQGLELRRGEAVLVDPHVLELSLVCQGRRDIASSDFDAGAALRFDLDATVIEILKITGTPKERALPCFEVDGTTLLVGPSLIARNQKVSCTVLVEGRPTLTCTDRPLINVTVAKSTETTSGVVVPLVCSAFSALGLVLVMLSSVGISFSYGRLNILDVIAAAVIGGNLVGWVQMITAWGDLLSRPRYDAP